MNRFTKDIKINNHLHEIFILQYTNNFSADSELADPILVESAKRPS